MNVQKTKVVRNYEKIIWRFIAAIFILLCCPENGLRRLSKMPDARYRGDKWRCHRCEANNKWLGKRELFNLLLFCFRIKLWKTKLFHTESIKGKAPPKLLSRKVKRIKSTWRGGNLCKAPPLKGKRIGDKSFIQVLHPAQFEKDANKRSSLFSCS